jgi:hypothetical protein
MEAFQTDSDIRNRSISSDVNSMPTINLRKYQKEITILELNHLVI